MRVSMSSYGRGGTASCSPSSSLRNSSGKKFVMIEISWPTLMNRPCSSQIARSIRRALRRWIERSAWLDPRLAVKPRAKAQPQVAPDHAPGRPVRAQAADAERRRARLVGFLTGTIASRLANDRSDRSTRVRRGRRRSHGARYQDRGTQRHGHRRRAPAARRPRAGRAVHRADPVASTTVAAAAAAATTTS